VKLILMSVRPIRVCTASAKMALLSILVSVSLGMKARTVTEKLTNVNVFVLVNTACAQVSQTSILLDRRPGSNNSNFFFRSHCGLRLPMRTWLGRQKLLCGFERLQRRHVLQRWNLHSMAPWRNGSPSELHLHRRIRRGEMPK
jgi:hypothetical protein